MSKNVQPRPLTNPELIGMRYLQLLALAHPLQALLNEPVFRPGMFSAETQEHLINELDEAMNHLRSVLATLSNGNEIELIPHDTEKVSQALTLIGLPPIGEE